MINGADMRSLTRAVTSIQLMLLSGLVSDPVFGQGVILRDGFERDSVGAAPLGWSGPRGDVRAFVAATNPAEGRRVLVLEQDESAGATAVGSISLRLGAKAYRGREIRFEAFVRSSLPDSASWSALWLRIDGPEGEVLYLDNMQDRPIRASDWQRYRLIAELAPNADSLILGAILVGPGRMALDSVTLEVIDSATIARRAPPTLAVQAYLDSALALMQRWSLRRSDIDWPALRARAEWRIRGAVTVEDSYRAIRAALAELGDSHSFFMQPSGASGWNSRGVDFPDSSVRRYRDRIGYISIPGYPGSDSAASVTFARQMQKAIARTDAPELCGWVVDLRQDVGGNMWPMLAGIGPILGDAIAGYFIAPGGMGHPWAYRQGASYEDSVVRVSVGPRPYQLRASTLPPVAVLLGGETASSGEAIAVSFLGRPRTRTFGTPTAGLTTANESYSLPDGAVIFLAVGVMADRSGRRYGGAISPEVPIADRDATTPDPTLDAALDWLLEDAVCK